MPQVTDDRLTRIRERLASPPAPITPNVTPALNEGIRKRVLAAVGAGPEAERRVQLTNYKSTFEQVLTRGGTLQHDSGDFDPPGSRRLGTIRLADGRAFQVAGTRNYLARYSRDALDIPGETIHPGRTDLEAIKILDGVRTSLPDIYGELMNRDEDVGRLEGLAKTAATLNVTPSSPRELLRAADRFTSKWATQRQLQLPSGYLDTLSKFLPNVKPFHSGLFPDVSQRMERDLLRNSLDPDAQRLFDTLGTEWTNDWLAAKGAYVSRDRLERLTGQPQFPEDQDVKSVRPVGLDDFAPISSTARFLLAAQQERAQSAAAETATGVQAQRRTAPVRAFAQEAAGRAQNTEVGKAVEGVFSLIAGGFNLATIGAIPSGLRLGNFALEKGTRLSDAVKEAAGYRQSPDTLESRWNQAVGRTFRNIDAFGDDSFTEPRARLEYLFELFPDAAPEDKAKLVADHYNLGGFFGRTISELRTRPAGKIATDFLAIGWPSLRLAIEDGLNAATADPVSFSLSVVGAGASAKTLFQRARPAGPLSAEVIDRGSPLAQSLARADSLGNSQFLDAVNGRLAKLSTPDAARGVISRLEQSLEGQYLTPELAGQTIHALDELRDRLDSLSGLRLDAPAREALRKLGPAIAELPADATFVLSGAEGWVSRSASLKLAEAQQKWIRDLEGYIARDAVTEGANPTAIPAPPRRLSAELAAVTGAYRTLVRGQADATEAAQNLRTLQEVTSTVDKRLQSELQAQELSLQNLQNARTGMIGETRDLYTQALSRAAKLEVEGGTLERAKAMVGTPFFKSVQEAYRQGLGDTDMLSLANDRSIGVLSDRALTNYWERYKLARDKQIGDVGEATALFTGHMRRVLDRWWNEVLTPDLVPRAANSRPRRKRLEAIQKRIDDAPPDQIPELTKADLEFLNEFRVVSLTGNGPRAAQAASSAILKAQTALTRHQELKRSLEDYRASLGAPDALTTELPRPSPELHNRIRELLDPAKNVLGEQPSALTLNPLRPELKTAREIYDNALTAADRDVQLLRNGLTEISAGELASLPPEIASDLLTYEVRSLEGRLNLARYNAARISARHGREFSAPELAQIWEDLDTGRPRSEEAIVEADALRRGLVDRALHTGMITPEMHAEYTGASYVHYTYDKNTQARRQAVLAPINAALPRRFRQLKVDPSGLKTRAPKEGYWATWKEPNGQVRSLKPSRDKGFDTPEAAAAALDARASQNVAEAAIHGPYPDAQRTLDGLVREPRAALLSGTEDLAASIAKHELQLLIRRSGRTRTAVELEIPGSQGSFIDGDGTRWRRFDDQGPLQGRYVDDRVTSAIAEVSDELPWFSEQIKALRDMEKELASNPFGDKRARFFQKTKNLLGTALRSYTNLFVLGKVGLSYSAVRNGIMTNTFYWKHAGANVLNYHDAYHMARLMKDGFQSRYRTKAADAAWDSLIKNNLVTVRRSSLNEGLEKVLDEYRTGLEPLKAQHNRAVQDLHDAETAQDFTLARALHLKRLALENKMQAAGAKNHGRFLKSWLTQTRKIYDGVGEAVVKGKGRLNDQVWSTYNLLSLDDLGKYALYRKLTEVDGLAESEALGRIRLFTQQLHSVPRRFRQLGETFGGARFTSFPVEQYRILRNVLKYRTPELAADWGALAAWNTTLLSANGYDPEEFLTVDAYQNRTRRGLVRDVFSLVTRAAVPVSLGPDRTLSFIDLGPRLFDTFETRSRVGRTMSNMLSQGVGGALGLDPQNPNLRTATDVVAGIANSFAFAEPTFQALVPLTTGVDDRGVRINSIGDYFSHLWRTIAPPGAPGTTPFNRIKLAAKDEAVDPATFRRESLAEAISAQLGVFSFPTDSPTKFHKALSAFLRQKSSAGTGPEMVLQESFDELKSTLVARGTVSRDGTVDLTKAEQILDEYYAGRPYSILGPTGDVIEIPRTGQVADEAARLAIPTALRLFSRLPIEQQLSFYALYRSADKRPVLEFDERVAGMISSKIAAGRTQPAQLNLAKSLLQSVLVDDFEELPPAAKARLRGWLNQLDEQQFERAERQ